MTKTETYRIFKKELTTLINKLSLENESDTPDFILAEYLINCFKQYNKNIKWRDAWKISKED